MLTYILGLLNTFKRIEIIFYAGKIGDAGKIGENSNPRALITTLITLLLGEVTSYLDTNYFHLPQQTYLAFLPNLIDIDHILSKVIIS